jgi:PPOX class probable FMN-dependent enzyme
MKHISTIEELEQIYAPAPKLASLAKEVNYLTPEYREYIRLSPFVALATVGPEGLDCSPRGDSGSVVNIVDDRTLALPDRRGNNRIDSLRNIVRDPRVALLFLIPGSGTTFRVNGKAVVTTDVEVCQRFVMDEKLPRTVVMIEIQAAYFQCARAILRSGLWKTEQADTVPTPGTVLERLTNGEINAETYDSDWPGKAATSLW